MKFKDIVSKVVAIAFGASWKTSLVGYVAYVAAESAVYFDKVQGGYGWHVAALAFLALARFAKDHDITGGTKATTPEAAARVEG